MFQCSSKTIRWFSHTWVQSNRDTALALSDLILGTGWWINCNMVRYPRGAHPKKKRHVSLACLAHSKRPAMTSVAVSCVFPLSVLASQPFLQKSVFRGMKLREHGLYCSFREKVVGMLWSWEPGALTGFGDVTGSIQTARSLREGKGCAVGARLATPELNSILWIDLSSINEGGSLNICAILLSVL